MRFPSVKMIRLRRFTLYPRPRTARRDQPAFKIKSVLRGTEYEREQRFLTDIFPDRVLRDHFPLSVSRQELIGWLQQQIAEQKRVDASTYGASALSDPPQSALPSKEVFGVPDVQLLLPGDVKMLGDPKKVPGDAKKQRRQVKQLFLDRGLSCPSWFAPPFSSTRAAYDAGMQLKSAVQSGIPTIAVDVPVLVFDALTKSSAWLSDEEAWKGISSGIASQSYAHLVREAVLKKRAEGYQFVLLFAVREERVHVFNLG
jgi:translation initiation factor 2-alpha kinase 4